ncbi:hypothetical protein BDQ94DRAFT_69694 [Aspergillus welwitschiae]|uniref:Uncharacterized protein n=1 Tax=Aspergillus welwitschiae TaxID=1341132 RepID=A0A3F3PUJ8_9EURO|nr:hypothetical protein BDQ94DRAFT_69694 [Aspergillus welwitschiae]RDH30604.1 hypothetical protein BDQ94DRAFT_69694 [Aspergillus welwitschiae]
MNSLLGLSAADRCPYPVSPQTRRLIGPSSLTSKSSHPRMSTGNSTNAAVSAKPCRHGKQLPQGHTAGSSYQWYCLAPHSLAVR